MAEAIEFMAPDAAILARRREIVEDLAELLPPERLVHEPFELVPFETDGFIAYRRRPLAVALPETTAQVAAVLKYCHKYGIPVVPRGAGTSLSGGAIPQEDAVVLGLSAMTRILDIDYANRTATVQAGVTNLSISDAVGADGFFYAPDPSSQLACTIGGNIGMNSGGAHCLKYGVTTNNLLGVKLVLVDGTVVELGGKALDAEGLDLLGLVCGSEGQLGVVTEATVRLLAKPEGARPVLFGFDSSEEAGACVADIIGAGIVPVAIEFMDKPAIEICEAFAHAGYPLDVEALLIVEVEGSEAEMEAMLASIVEIARRHGVKTVRESQSATEAALIWKGRKSALAPRPHRRLYLHGWHGAAQPTVLCPEEDSRDHRPLRPALRQCLPCGGWQHASADPLQHQRPRRCRPRRSGRHGHPEALRRCRRLPDRRTRRRHRKTRPDAPSICGGRSRPADGGARRLRPEMDAEPLQGLPAGWEDGGVMVSMVSGIRERYPPLACRPSPPQGGRSASRSRSLHIWRIAEALPLSVSYALTRFRMSLVSRKRAGAAGRSPSLWGRCPAGQRGVPGIPTRSNWTQPRLSPTPQRHHPMLTPATESQAADIIRDHAARGHHLKITGGNTRGEIGNPVETVETLSSTGLSGISAYNPAEMVMTAWAGTPVSVIEAALAQTGQMMAFEPIDHRPVMGTTGEPTIGGVFATNASGLDASRQVPPATICSACASSMAVGRSSRPADG